MIVDFHSHTCESDGTLSPAELCGVMQKRGVAVFSITDHDTLAAYDGLSVPPGMRVIVGIEVNTSYRGNEVHVLGFGIRRNDEHFEQLLEYNVRARRERIERIVEQLKEAGYPITLEQVLAEAGGARPLGRPHVGKALIRHGHIADIETAFRLLLRHGKPGYVASTHITPQQAIAEIGAAGGVAVLAHPGRLRDYGIIDELAADGLRGLEVFYPRHDRAQTQFFRDTARRLSLVMTGGSDFHDARYNSRGVGIEVEAADIQPFLDTVT
ncbi:MAG: PHP domain-containing protein [Candidatus Eremiobacteraeota bacterium]|nr:PHP domain-containing protein [Candidatus Eremiobacteraeota bacterium]